MADLCGVAGKSRCGELPQGAVNERTILVIWCKLGAHTMMGIGSICASEFWQGISGPISVLPSFMHADFF